MAEFVSGCRKGRGVRFGRVRGLPALARSFARVAHDQKTRKEQEPQQKRRNSSMEKERKKRKKKEKKKEERSRHSPLSSSTFHLM